METDRFQRLSEIFERVVAVPAGERAAVLLEECNGDAGLREEVENLLKHSEGPDDPVVTAAGLDALFEEAGLRPRSDHVSIPDVIGGNSHHTPSGMTGGIGMGGPNAPMPVLTGQYRILRVVGEGGMGIVYEAEQAFPKRRVALKSIRPGMFSRRMLRRFQNEAHILGRLQHPGIAQIYEAGASDPQRPDDAFFVMEFVDGPPLTTFAESRKLGSRQRVELMIKVCEAVQHAHQRGVIHRDLKPANILVTDSQGEGGEAQPKILDFGVARVTDDESKADSMHTRAGQLVGTLAYMSPEQISSDAHEPDTRADVYALGVTLYQLLSGRLPHDLADKSIPDAAAIVRDTEPSKLGTIDRTYRGDLETIVAKAMDKNRTRRYQSAAELGEDLRRYLAGEAIAAKRDSAMYVLRKQVRRHKGAVAAGGVILVGLVTFAVVSAMQAKHNLVLADQLADQLTIANCERGRLLTLSGSPALGEKVLWTEFLQRPDMIEPHWALWEYYARQPVVAASGGAGVQPGRLAVTPDRTKVFRGGREGQIEVWTSDLKTCLWKGECEAGQINDAVVMPDGESIVCATSKSRLLRIDLGTGRVLARKDLPTRRINAMAVTPDGAEVITGDADGVIVAHRASDLSVARRLSERAIAVSWISVSPSGDSMVVSQHRGIYGVWDLKLGKLMGNLPIKSGVGLRTQFTSDGTRCLALTDDGIVHTFSTEGWAAGPSINTGDAGTRSMLLLDDQTLVTFAPVCVRIWDLASGTLRATMPGDEGGLAGLSPGPRPGTFYTLGMGTAIRLWETRPLAGVRTFELGSKHWVYGAARPGSDAPLLAMVDGLGVVRTFDPVRGTIVGQIQGPSSSGLGMAWRPGRNQFAAIFGNDVALFDPADSVPRKAASWHVHDGRASAWAFSHDGALLATAAEDGEIFIWDVEKQEMVRRVGGVQTKIRGVCFSPDGRTLAVAGMKPGIALYGLADGKMISSIADNYENRRVMFSPDGKTIAAARARPEIQILDAETLEVLRTLQGHSSSINGLDFDSTGELLASAGQDQTVRLWNVRTGRSLIALETKAPLSTVAFIPGTQSIAAFGGQGWAGIWDPSHYDQHIAGSLSYYVARIGSGLERPVDTEHFVQWARRATGDEAFTLADPAASARQLGVDAGAPKVDPNAGEGE